ncbi:hypothetical protein, partial [Mesorhizobium sp. M0040]|uniref:hypothetical protein n=1 Tax=Mesorhizobium sp. M0040 TaxID=2956855 RepID=UPI003334AB17
VLHPIGGQPAGQMFEHRRHISGGHRFRDYFMFVLINEKRRQKVSLAVFNFQGKGFFSRRGKIHKNFVRESWLLSSCHRELAYPQVVKTNTVRVQ